MMIDREKVIKGFTYCLNHVEPGEYDCPHFACPYFHEYKAGKCISASVRDALELLKAQEPVVHGRWAEKHVDYASDCAIDEVQTAKCSICGLYHTAPYMSSNLLNGS